MARRSRADRESAVAKVRVYELAKEFGVESKAVMAKLQEMGEFVRSASSTIEAPVVRRLKEAFAGHAAAAKASAAQAAADGGRRAANGRADVAAPAADAAPAASAAARSAGLGWNVRAPGRRAWPGCRPAGRAWPDRRPEAGRPAPDGPAGTWRSR